MAVLTQAAEFTYKGKKNDDVFVVTLVFEREDKEVGGEWQVSYMQRSQAGFHQSRSRCSSSARTTRAASVPVLRAGACTCR